VAEELMIFARPWGFALKDVNVPVHLWHGAADVNVPFHIAQEMSRQLPQATTHFSQDSAHAVGFEDRATVMKVITAGRPSNPTLGEPQ
jgi:pimeloyl-ACP methyl ester carboxylesterase